MHSIYFNRRSSQLLFHNLFKRILRSMASTGYTRKKIENYSYGLGDIIGKGYSSQVYRGRNDETNEAVAVKVIDLKMLKNQINKVLLESEIEILKELRSEQNILSLQNVYTTKNNTYIITELCDSDLNKVIKNKVTEHQAIAYMQQIITGYLNFANKDIIHRDLKPANILTTTHQLKIADFGFAIKLTEASKSTKYNVGSPLYMAPESLKKNQYSLKTDIWALGIIYYEMLVGETPWRAKNEKELLKRIETQKIEVFLSKISFSQASKQFLQKTLKLDKNHRMDLKELEAFNFKQGSSKVLMEKKLNLILQTGKQETIAPNQSKRNIFASLKTLHSFESNNKVLSIENNKIAKTKVSEPKTIFTEAKAIFTELKTISTEAKAISTEANTKDVLNQSIPLKNILNKNTSPIIIANMKKKNSIALVDNTVINPEVIEEGNKKEFMKKDIKKNISKILISEVHFCRFMFKLLGRMEESKKDGILRSVESDVVGNVFANYTGIIKHKITNLMDLRDRNYINTSQYEDYLGTNDFAKLMKISKEYNDRYKSQLLEYWQDAVCEFTTKPTNSLMQVLYTALELISSSSNKAESEENIKEFTEDIIILDYLMTCTQLIQMQENGEDYEQFAKKSRIEEIVEGKTANITFELFHKIMKRAHQMLNLTPKDQCQQNFVSFGGELLQVQRLQVSSGN